ncbi:type II toxin-antitoxin system PemK/MazF family toxin [Algoriphagus vanfongensis]|uniref:type II toxin-antitoxin system PemK/MazF family toxin n=1 Tax=Algoriphagus vanfongensis TaxID=426371 RepID=UPI00040DB6FE|nr:type II toxin-antitoxin system PemK/MazF family toxin [Algoriphagus vanfongensis]
MELKQYSIVLVNLDPTIGSEIKKTRPCVIISPNEMNKYLNAIVLAPMTTNLRKYPTRVPVNHNGKRGMVAMDQIRTVDKSRIIKIFETLSPPQIDACKAVIKETFVD